ncbi:MAG: hypothetical protein WCY09_09830 [Candidatus Omnitrophota bacterium]
MTFNKDAKKHSAKDLEAEMRTALGAETTTTGTTGTSGSGYVVALYAAPMPDDGGYYQTPWTPPVPVTDHSDQYIALLRLIVGLETQLAEVKNQLAELKQAFENRDVVEGWNLTREQFVQLAEAAHKIISGVAKPKRTRKRTPKST